MTPTSVGEFLGGYRPPRFSITINARADLQDRLSKLDDELVQIKRSDALNDPRPGEIVAEMQELHEELSASEFEFTFESIGSFRYSKLAEAHPPLPAERANGVQVHGPTFFPALLAACAVQPQMTSAEASEMRVVLSDAQWSKLVNTALAVNLGDDATPKFDARSLLAVVAPQSSDTPLSEESPDPDSSDE